MGESRYLLMAQPEQSRQSNQSPRDSPTPFSAVSSFNLPSFCDSTLITPLTQSPPAATRAATALKIEQRLTLSPSELSPAFQFVTSDDEYQPRYVENPPMKHKHPSGSFYASSTDHAFPASPFVCPEPFWGAYGVSATPVSLSSESSSSAVQSPAHMHSAGGLSSSSSYSPPQYSPQNASGYRRKHHTPILMKPSPPFLRPATNPSQHHSLQSFPISTAHSPFPETLKSLTPRGRKRKSPARDSNNRPLKLRSTDKEEEKLLLQLTYFQSPPMPWKQVVIIWKEKFGKEVSDASLQMKRFRLVDRLREWTLEDERALAQAIEELGTAEWEKIPECMLKYGCEKKWSKQACQKQWEEMYPEEGTLQYYSPQYDNVKMEYRSSGDWSHDEDAYSDSHTSGCQSLQDGESESLASAIPTVTMDQVRSRASSNSTAQMFGERLDPQEPVLYRLQSQRHGWGPEA